MHTNFEWDDAKNRANQKKHGVSFSEAQDVFFDRKHVVHEDLTHSKVEKRFYCFGKVGNGILTVRFTYRNESIRIIGAGYWRKGRKIYKQSLLEYHEKKNNLY